MPRTGVPRVQSRVKPKQNRYRQSLVRTVLVVLLLVSLLPIILIGTLNYFRSRTLLDRQVSRQLENIMYHNVDQIQQFVDLRESMISRLVTDETLSGYLLALLNLPTESEETNQARLALAESVQTEAESFFDQVFLLDPDGMVLFSTDNQWILTNFGGERVNHQFVRGLIGTNQSVFVYNPTSSYVNQMVLFSSRSFVDEDGYQVATLVGASTSDLLFRILSDSRSFLPGAFSYYFTDDRALIGTSQQGKLIRMEENPGLGSFTDPLIRDQRSQRLFRAKSYENNPVVAFAEWVPEYHVGIILAVSERSVYEQNNIFDPFNLILLGLSLVISGTLIYYGSTLLVNPLVQLAHTAESFSKGNWDQRARIKREDEIGMLANAFNNMADELSDLYHSLEAVVEKRTRQLRIASEVGQIATSTTHLKDTLTRAVQLIAERFGFYHVAIYLIDETGRAVVLQEASGNASEQIKLLGQRVEINQHSLVGWVAANNQARILSNLQDDPLYLQHVLLPDSRSELAVPVAIGSEVLGVLDIQSTQPDSFDQETVAVFQTLANQISSSMQNTRLLETSQVSFQETNLLYQTTRQVTEARTEQEIVQALAKTLTQMPYIGAVLSAQGENMQILLVTDPKTHQVDYSLQSLRILAGDAAAKLVEDRVVVVDDISKPSPYANLVSFLLRRDCVSAALISVLENGHLSKVIVLGSPESNRITHAVLQPYANLAEVSGSSLEKLYVLNTLQHRLTELQVLASFSQAISAETELNSLYRALHQQIMQTFSPDLEFAIAIYHEQENLIEFPYFFEKGQQISIQPFKLGEGLTSRLIESRLPLVLPSEQAIRMYTAKIIGKPAKSWLGIPLIFAGSIVGAMIIQDLENENRFNEDDVNLVMTLAPQIATAIRNTQLYTETQQALKAFDQEHFLINTILNHIPEGISFKDMQGRYIRVSNSVAAMYSISAEEIIGKTDDDLLDQETGLQIRLEEQAVLQSGQAQVGLVQQLTSASGEKIWAHTSRLPIQTSSGEPYGLLIIQRDITELKQAEALAQRRAEQVMIAAEIARDTTGTLDVKTLLKKTVDLVRDRFGFYHASIFLLDEAGEYATLRESTGQAGMEMLRTGHQLAVGSKSIVGQVTSTGKPLIVNDVHSDPTHFPNPLLPDTNSELAIPLKIGERVLGAMDVQSTQVGAFHEDDIAVLHILADQLAVAIVNGELFAKTQELLGKHRLLRQITIAGSSSTNLEDALVNVVSGLQTAKIGDRIAILMLDDEGKLRVQASAGYEGTQHLEARIALGEGITGLAAAEKRLIRVDNTLVDPYYIAFDPDVRSELAIPILFNDELLGVLNLESTMLAAFDENDQEILGALGNNLGGVMANVRLVNQVRQQVIRQRQLFEVASQIRRSVDLETILETSTKEIARALGARRAHVQITAGSQPASESTGDRHIPGNGHHSGGEGGK